MVENVGFALILSMMPPGDAAPGAIGVAPSAPLSGPVAPPSGPGSMPDAPPPSGGASPPATPPTGGGSPPTDVAPPPSGGATEPVYVNYSDTWDEDPPPPRRTLVVTHVVHQPQRPPPPIPEEPPPVPEPRARGFVGLSLRGTTTNYNPSALVGGRAGFTFRDRFTIGGAFHSLTARYAGPIVDAQGRQLGLRMSYGGVTLGWRLYSGRVVQLGVETLAGAGAACISRDKRSVGRARCLEKVGLVAIEPGVELAFVITDWTRLGLTGGYRFVTREAWREPNDFTLSGPYVGLNLDFGRFRERG